MKRSSKRSKILTQEQLLALAADQTWRLNHLYSIKTKEGKKLPFRPNKVQQSLLDNLHTCNIILKARQLGITTLFCILLLDKVLWNRNVNAAIIAHTQDDASNIFQDKLKYAFDQLDPRIRPLFKTIGDSAKELAFSHGSTIRVGTSLRSSTLQYLHISEFGKICAKYPEKAREIITGSLNTIAPGQHIFIESTAEGKEGAFHDMVEEARKPHDRLSPMDFCFHFFPWFCDPEYTLGVAQDISSDLKDYFAKLAILGIQLTDPQKWWYAAKLKTQKDDMYREFPSTPDEAFQASKEGYWYSTYINELYESGHITNIAYDRALPVHTAWDLGQRDDTSIWFFQINRSDDINLIDFFQKNRTPLDQLSIMLKSKNYNYGTHIFPHDADSDHHGTTFMQLARPLGINGIVLKPHGILDGINLVKNTLNKCWFDKTKCATGLNHLQNYGKKWNNSYGGWSSEPIHNEASHAADAFRYLCAGIKLITGSEGSVEKDFSILRKFWGN